MSTEIMNQALDLLEEEPILSMDDNRAAVRWMKRNYDPARKALIRMHPWNFALRRALLIVEANAPLFGWRYSYNLPNDCLRVLPLTSNGNPTYGSLDFQVEGRKLLTNAGSPRPIRYLADITDPRIFDPMFVDALATRLAWKAASFITGKMNYAQLCQQAHANALMQAQMIDSLEGTPERPEADDWINGRSGNEFDYRFDDSAGGISGIGGIDVSTLPTTAPSIPGQLWNNGGVVSIS
jgi:hypothetical protein